MIPTRYSSKTSFIQSFLIISTLQTRHITQRIYAWFGFSFSPRCGSEYVGPVRLTALHPAAPCPAAACTRRYPGCRVFVSAKVSLSFNFSEYLPPISHAGVPLILFLLLLRFLVRSAIFLYQYSVTQTNASSRSSLPLIILKRMF